MQKSSSHYKSHWHCVYHLKYHLVLVTKYRKKCFTQEILARLKDICTELAKQWDIEVVEFGGEYASQYYAKSVCWQPQNSQQPLY